MPMSGRDRALPAFADLDHFGDPNEMILDTLSAVETGGAGLLHDGLKIAVVRVVQDFGEVAGRPEFVTCGVRAANALERGEGLRHDVIFFLKSG